MKLTDLIKEQSIMNPASELLDLISAPDIKSRLSALMDTLDDSSASKLSDAYNAFYEKIKEYEK